jgi:YggT family protein
MQMVLQIICILLSILYLILIVRIILSWVPRLPEPVMPLANAVRAVTDPLLTPLRGLLPPVRLGAAALDLSPLILFFGIIILQRLICR